MYRFTSKPAWTLVELKKGEAAPEAYEALETPVKPADIVSRALARIEYRTLTLLARVEQAVAQGPSDVVIARPPNDLPALLRTADQLLTFSRLEAGERASVWRCECGTRYAVPVSLMRPVSIRCERCGRTLDLDPLRVVEHSHLADPLMAEVNAYRKAVADVFREAMARGWPVLVSKADQAG
ncbi:MAG: zinc-ribbon domain-containing protein [Myxococcaceae bacterium]|jgi:hypothetical protein|nr:zinc-ribbon domain-containing protein [Myxococcaceae bacterium]